jgi:hypothetical protein
MLDLQPTRTAPIPRIEVEDYIEMGRLVAEWATDPTSRPRDVASLKEQLVGVAAIPARVRTVGFVQCTLEHLVIRLPAKELVEDALERASDPMGGPRHTLPQFYADHCRPGFGPVMTPLDTLLARVGDHAIAQCR